MHTVAQSAWVSKLVKELAIELHLRLHFLQTASGEKTHKFTDSTSDSS
jgi:hypothetical protein